MGMLVAGLAALSLAVSALACASLLRHPPAGLLRPNFHGRNLPLAGGLVLLCALVAGELALSVAKLVVSHGAAARAFASRGHWGLAVVALGFFGLGLLDDLVDGGHYRGLRGHFRALARGRLTGGAIKALGGVALGLIAGASWETHLGPAVLDAALVALSANLINLLDLRPGRAVKVYLVAWAALAAAAWGSAYVPVSVSVTAGAALWLLADVRERGMLGDVGANLLGAVAGAGAALTLGAVARLGVLVGLGALTLASERWSFSKAIDALAPLRWLDRLGRPPDQDGARSS